jgi:carbonic anhydrase
MARHILEQSGKLRQDFFEREAELLEQQITEGQQPQGLFIGCSDSRVVPEQLFGLKPGDLFMLRNIANIVPPYDRSDPGITAVLEYAVQHLHVPHIIVCGHTDCGGIKGLDASLDPAAEPALASWLEFARLAQQSVQAGLKPDLWERHRAIVERNVVQQLRHLQTYPFVSKALEANRLELHGWVYYLRRRLIGHYLPGPDRFEVINSSNPKGL